MNKVIFLVSFLSSISLYSQNEYPKLVIDSTGNEFISFTIDQARIIDNNMEILNLFKGMSIDVINYDSLCDLTVQQKDSIIFLQEEKMNDLGLLLEDNKNQITILEKSIEYYKKNEGINENIIKNKDKEILLHKKENLKLKKKSIVGGILGGSTIIGLVISLILT